MEFDNKRFWGITEILNAQEENNAYIDWEAMGSSYPMLKLIPVNNLYLKDLTPEVAQYVCDMWCHIMLEQTDECGYFPTANEMLLVAETLITAFYFRRPMKSGIEWVVDHHGEYTPSKPIVPDEEDQVIYDLWRLAAYAPTTRDIISTIHPPSVDPDADIAEVYGPFLDAIDHIEVVVRIVNKDGSIIEKVQKEDYKRDI